MEAMFIYAREPRIVYVQRPAMSTPGLLMWSKSMMLSSSVDACGPAVSPPGISSSSATSRHKPRLVDLLLDWLSGSSFISVLIPPFQHLRCCPCREFPLEGAGDTPV